MVEELFSLMIPASDKSRGVAAADFGFRDSFHLKDDLTAAGLSAYIQRSAAVAFWLPARSHALITVSRHLDPKHSPQFHFSYEVLGCHCKFNKDAKLVVEDPKKVAAALAIDVFWIVFCNGSVSIIPCPVGQHGECTEAGAACSVSL